MCTETDQKYAGLMEIGKSTLSSLKDMVAALECDYDRLEELRGEKWSYESLGTGRTFDEASPDYAEELKDLEETAGDCTSREDAEQRIMEDTLSIEYRSGWSTSKDDLEAEEVCILISTGGPATRIIGELLDGQAYRPRLEVQDWGTPWTHYYEEGAQETLEAYCSVFCFE